jgi:hypothetical protein
LRQVEEARDRFRFAFPSLVKASPKDFSVRSAHIGYQNIEIPVPEAPALLSIAGCATQNPRLFGAGAPDFRHQDRALFLGEDIAHNLLNLKRVSAVPL